LIAAALMGGLFLACADSASAQVTTGNITGTVTDQQGGALPGAVVVATHVPTGTPYKTVTDKDGRFQVLEVRIGGPYTVTVTMSGFKDQTQASITVKLGEDSPLKFSLELQKLSETVEVATTPIDFAEAGATSNINQFQKDSVPTIARAIFDVIQTNPYFSNYTTTGNGQASISVAGRNNRYNNIQIDGAVNNDIFGLSASGTPEGQTSSQPISLDAIAEFQLLVTPYDVRQGGFSGGGVNIVTRSGANTMSGDGFFYGRNQSWVGKYFNAYTTVKDSGGNVTGVGAETGPIATFSDKQGGGSIGGAIKQNRMFFFASSDSQRQQTPSGIHVDGSSPNFATALPDNGNAAIDTILATLNTKYGYDPTGGSGIDPKSDFIKGTNSDKVFVRVDFNLKPGQRLTIRNNYINSSADTGTPSATSFLLPDNYVHFHITTNSTVGQLNSTIGTNSVNEFRVAATEVRNNRGGQPFEQSPFPRTSITIASGTTVVFGREQSSTANRLYQDDIEVNDDFTAVRGNHTISLGTHDEFFHFQNLFIQNTFGNYAFTSAAFNGIPNFQAGLAQQYTYGLSLTPDPRQQSDFRVAQFGFYAGDQWRARSNLTLTGGVRVDLPRINHTPPANPAILQTFNMATDVVPSPTQFSPRVGFNWDPRGKAKEQLRGGIGIFSGRTPYVWISNQFANDGVSFGSVAIASNNNNKIPYVTDPNAQPTNPSGGTVGVTKTVVNLVDPNFKFPTQMRASLAYDSNLPGGLIGKGEVLFNKTLEDIKYSNLNITPVGTLNLDGRNIYSQTVPGAPATQGAVLLLSNTTQGHGWTFTYDVKRSFRNKFAFDVGYLYGQAFNAVESQSSVALTSWQNVFTPNDPNNTPVTRSDFDPGHRVTVNASYEQPIGKLALLFSMFYSGQSGHPYTLSWSSDVNSDGSGFNDNLFIPASGNGLTFTGNGATYDTLVNFLNTLGKCATDQIGSTFVRNSCRAPWINNLNTRFTLRLPYKKVKTDITLDILNLANLLNHNWGEQRFVNFNQIANVGATFTNGQITGYNLATINPTIPGTFNPFQYDDVRSRWQMQLGARISF
jgi:hypothetical protein